MLFRNLIKTITLFDLVRNGIWIFLCLLVVYSNFWETNSGDVPFLILFILASLVPFFMGTMSLIELAKKLERSGSNIIQKIEAVVFSLALFGAIIMLIWLHKSDEPVAALVYALQHPNWILMLVLAVFSVHFGTQAYQDSRAYHDFKPAGKCTLGTYGISIFVGIHLMNLYFFLGIDDGCYAVGSDPLFGGAEYYECDEQYTKKVEANEIIASQLNFNARALFAAEVFILLVFSSSALV